MVSIDTAAITASAGLYVKVAHDLMKYLMESGECTANCARASERALISTGWERTRKVKDVADTVYNIVEAKWTCDKKTAALARDWVNTYLNARLSTYKHDPTVKPEPVKPSGGVVVSVVEVVTEALGIPTVFNAREYAKDTKIESLDVNIKGNEVTVVANLYNPGISTEEVKAELWLGDTLIDTEPDTYWKNVRGGQRRTIKLSSHWKSSNIEMALGGKVVLKEEHLGILDSKTFSLGLSGILAWIKGLGWKAAALIGVAIIVIVAIILSKQTPHYKAAEKMLKKGGN